MENAPKKLEDIESRASGKAGGDGAIAEDQRTAEFKPRMLHHNQPTSQEQPCSPNSPSAYS